MRPFVHCAWFVVAGLVFAGCASARAPDPAPKGEPERQQEVADPSVTAEVVFGDVTTVDYCSLVDVRVLSAVMTVTGAARPSFTHCAVDGSVQGKTIEVKVGYLGGPGEYREWELVPDRQLPDGLTVERAANDHDGCDLFLAFDDGYRLRMNATPDPGDRRGTISQEQSCLVADQALESVVEAVTGSGAVRHFTFADNSLGSLDTCDVLTSMQVASALRVRSVEIHNSPGGHVCRWQVGKEVDPHTLMATLHFRVDHAPESSSWDSETIAGRRTFVLDGSSSCSLSMVHVPFPEAPDGESEIAILYVQTFAKEGACAVGRTLAESAWAQLPPL